jgi:uncharacterized protein
MRHFLILCVFVFALASTGLAQENPADAPASREDVEKYFAITHSKEMLSKMMDSMSKPMHQMIHEQFAKNQANLPLDFETRMLKILDDDFQSTPWDQILDSIIPVYQRHFTKGDMDSLVAFYSTGTGQKLLKELPQITAEAMQNMMPVLQKRMEDTSRRINEEVEAMIKESKKKTNNN